MKFFGFREKPPSSDAKQSGESVDAETAQAESDEELMASLNEVVQPADVPEDQVSTSVDAGTTADFKIDHSLHESVIDYDGENSGFSKRDIINPEQPDVLKRKKGVEGRKSDDSLL